MTTMMQLISQELFDEMLLENQDVFEYDDDEQAVAETVKEIQDQQKSNTNNQQPVLDNHSTSLDYLSLTHPNSDAGKKDRLMQQKLVECLAMSDRSEDRDIDDDNNNLETALSIIHDLSNSNKVSVAWRLMLQNRLLTSQPPSSSSTDRLLIDLTLALVPKNISIQDQLCKAVKLHLSKVWFDPASSPLSSSLSSTARWFKCLASTKSLTVRGLLLQVGRNLCNGAEHNKKTFVATAMQFQHQTDCGASVEYNGLELLVRKCLVVADDCYTSLPSSADSTNSVNGDSSTTGDVISVARDACQLLAVLCRFQPMAEQHIGASSPAIAGGGEPPLVSSAHANVKEFHKAGALPKLYHIVDSCLQDDQYLYNSRGRSLLLCDAMTALRVMAIDNDIVQNMVALGLLHVVTKSLQMALRDVQRRLDSGSNYISDIYAENDKNPTKDGLAFVTATFGLVRNLCANDEIKTTICKSSLGPILALMQHHQVSAINSSSSSSSSSCSQQQQQLLQEHSCGILAAMALKQPQNASSICESNGHILIFHAMQAYPQVVTLQRQACLALRNIASRIEPASKQMILDAGAERIIQQSAGCHQGSIEEAFAALRDLGCNPKLQQLDENGKLKCTEEFGKVKSNFRAVYE